MERLTKKIDGCTVFPEELIGVTLVPDNPIMCKMLLRLAAYEDTGLTPKEVKRMSNILMDVGIDYNCSWEYVKNWLLDDRLRELAEADKDGRVMVPPCEVGDVVYGFHGEKTILPMVAKWIETNTDGWCVAVQYAPMAPRFYRFSDFGKTVFLTREEAEKALESMRKEGAAW